MDTLADELILYICKYLNTQDKLSVIKTCKKIYNLKSEILTTMCLSSITRVDSSISNFCNLKCIDLYNSSIDELPTSFETLIHLQSLNLCHTRIKVVSNLPRNLLYLDISDNDFNCIPSSIIHLDKLQSLTCSWNNIDDIECLHNLNVIELNISHNDITSITRLPAHLQYLDASFNCLTSINIPDTIIELNISMNNLSTLSGCINVEHLNAIGNELKSIPNAPYKKLYLTSNNINYLAFYPNLDTLYIDDNPITCIQKCRNVVKDDEQLFTF
jgi:Leucine-rich repeat (LRR) protein